MFSRALPFVLGPYLLLACTEKPKNDARPAPTAPWAAPQPSASTGKPAAGTNRYRIEPTSVVEVKLPAKEARPSGTFTGVRGSFEVDLRELSNTRGALEVDLDSIVLQNATDAASDYTRQAKNWLNLGDSRPPADVARVRTARFTLTSIVSSSASAPHLGRVVPVPHDSHTFAAERRRITATALGQLEINGLRTTREARLELDFDYASAATAALPPLSIAVRTARPIPVPLAEHAIEPRDAQGRLIAGDLALLGRVIGTTAQVEVELVARP
jgi:hypothetical protein